MKSLRVGTYNICHAHYANGDLNKIGGVIREAALDICGIQEIEYKSTRVGGVNQPKLLSEACGLPYYRFVRAIDYADGYYGTMILSRFPIVGFSMEELESGTSEKRAIGHAVLDLGMKKLDFFCTHLSVESPELRAPQFSRLSELLAPCHSYILTGDFNTDLFDEFSVLRAADMANKAERRIVTFPGSQCAIDNIIISQNMKFGEIGTVTDSYTDHYMLWADVTVE